MTFPVHSSIEPLTNPEIGYRIIHHHKNANNLHHPNATIYYELAGTYSDLGTFPSFTAAQAAVSREVALIQEHQGSLQTARWAQPASCDECGLTIVRTREHIAYDFEIQLVQLCREVWTPSAGCADALFIGDENIQPMIRLPSEIDRRSSLPEAEPDGYNKERNDEKRKSNAVWREEDHPLWAQSRIPLMSRRHEGPFRDPSDEPYAEMLGYVRPIRRMKPHHSIVPIVTEQPDELAKTNEEVCLVEV
jgi:hypothetical protein